MRPASTLLRFLNRLGGLLDKAWQATSRNRNRAIMLTTLVVLSLLLAIQFWSGWRQQLNESVTCHEPDTFGDYFQIELTEQHPTEPSFNGKFFLLVQNWQSEPPGEIKVTRSGGRSYLQSFYRLRPVVDRDKNLTPPKFVDFSLITEQGSHRFFPFDKGKFDFSITVEPALKFETFRIVNRVPGFIMDCESLKTVELGNGVYDVSFEVVRNPVTKLTCLVVVAASLVFLFLTMAIKDTEALATAVASFFFSLWSIRGIFSADIKTFPTLLDSAILTVSVLMVISLLFKLTLRLTSKIKKP